MQRLLTSVLLLLAACGPAAPTRRLHLTAPDHVRHIRPGCVYQLQYAEAVDTEDVGTVWTSADLSGSPLAHMARTPLIIKADDFGGLLNERQISFLQLANDHAALVSLGMMTSFLVEEGEDNETYAALAALGHELWFHGHEHDWQGPTAEFHGASREAQVASFSLGLEAGRRILGVDLRTFGAPANLFDGLTAGVIRDFPQIVVWLFGDDAATELADTEVMVLPRLLDLEESVGVIRDPSAFVASLEAVRLADAPAVVTLQTHPDRFAQQDRLRLREVFEVLDRLARYRYSTPFGWWKWRADAGLIRISKTGAATYTLDLSQARFEHRVSFDSAMVPVMSGCGT